MNEGPSSTIFGQGKLGSNLGGGCARWNGEEIDAVYRVAVLRFVGRPVETRRQ